MDKLTIGIIGLSTMGKALALNVADHQIKVAGYNRSCEITMKMIQENYENFTGFINLKEFVEALEKPRRIIMMIKAGEGIDALIKQLIPYLEVDDILMDGGNSFFMDTIKRQRYLKELGIYYYGVGISGGEKGARFGPSMMPGGDASKYNSIQWIFECIAAKSEGNPCVTYIGENGSGHFVKMVHNGIEYADMQVLAEAFLLLKELTSMQQETLTKVFKQWNSGLTKSYLMDITSNIIQEKDDLSDGYLIEHIKCVSQQKGTGRWTSIEALQQGIDVSMIQAASNARSLTELAKERNLLSSNITVTKEKQKNQEAFIEQVHDALYVSRIIAYAQGFSLLHKGSTNYDWDLKLGQIASIFKAGCIIQSALLEPIREAYERNTALTNLLLDPFFLEEVKRCQIGLRKVVAIGAINGIALPAMMSALTYLDSLSNHNNGANLIQAQRDYFGAHTYERNDTEGIYHHDWNHII